MQAPSPPSFADVKGLAGCHEDHAASRAPGEREGHLGIGVVGVVGRDEAPGRKASEQGEVVRSDIEFRVADDDDSIQKRGKRDEPSPGLCRSEIRPR